MRAGLSRARRKQSTECVPARATGATRPQRGSPSLCLRYGRYRRAREPEMIDAVLLGTGGMLPLPNRWLSSLLIRVNGYLTLFDCGEGTQIAWRQSGGASAARNNLHLAHPRGPYCRAAGSPARGRECRSNRTRRHIRTRGYGGRRERSSRDCAGLAVRDSGNRATRRTGSQSSVVCSAPVNRETTLYPCSPTELTSCVAGPSCPIAHVR